MSRDDARREDPRYDSALSLALDQQLPLRSSPSLHGPHASQPWSSYNVRQDSLTNTESTVETPASSLYEDDSALQRQTTSPKVFGSIPRSSSPLTLSVSSDVAASGVISCGYCAANFSGTYRRGNLARHVRQKHGQASGRFYACRALDCSHEFRRQDARLKHERKSHSELQHSPVEPRRYHEQGSSDAVSYGPTSECALGMPPESGQHTTKDCVSDIKTADAVQGLSTNEHTSESLLAAWRVFAQLHATLDEEEYSLACDTLFTRWEAIAQELKDRKSDAYDVYAQALNDLYLVIADIDCKVPVDHEDEYLRQRGPYQENVQHGYGQAASPGSGTNASVGHNDKPQHHLWRPTELDDCKASARQKGKGRKGPIPRVDCPMYKHWLVYRTGNIPPPCRGCSANSMNQVRNHVKQRHVGERVGMIPFFHHCTRCEANFVEIAAGNSHIVARACAHTPQLRNNIITPWAQLYLAIYPEITQVPRPFTGEGGFLPPAVVTQCRPSTRSFLGHRSSENIPEPPQTSTSNAPPTEQPIYNAVMHTMLQEANHYLPAGDSQTHSNVLATNSLNSTGPSHTRAVFQSQLFNIQSNLLGVLLDAPRYLPPEQITEAAHFLQQIVDVVRAFQAASMAPAASIADTQPSSENPDNVFSDITLSPQTDQTAPPNALPASPSRLCEYGRYPQTHDGEVPLPMDPDQHDLAYLYNPPTLDLGSAVDDADFTGTLSFENGA